MGGKFAERLKSAPHLNYRAFLKDLFTPRLKNVDPNITPPSQNRNKEKSAAGQPAWKLVQK